MERTIEWILSNGKTATYTIKLRLTKEIDLDGDRDTVPCCEINTYIDVPGMGSIMPHIVQRSGQLGTLAYVAVIGGKIAISAETYNRIMAAISEIKTHPAWVAKQETIARNEAASRKLWSDRKRNGYCPQCHSYCYGDCGAN